MTEAKRPTINWMDVLWLVLLAALALLPPIEEYHKQLILLAFGVIQLGEGWVIARLPRRGPAYLVLLKIGLATLLILHTGEIPINSYYYLISCLPADKVGVLARDLRCGRRWHRLLIVPFVSCAAEFEIRQGMDDWRSGCFLLSRASGGNASS
jgi:hypothetical protein